MVSNEVKEKNERVREKLNLIVDNIPIKQSYFCTLLNINPCHLTRFKQGTVKLNIRHLIPLEKSLDIIINAKKKLESII